MYFDAFSFFTSWIRYSCHSSGTARPDSISISCVLKSLSGYDDFWFGSLARQIHGFVLHGGFDSDVFVGNGMITYCTKCDDVASARKVFDGMLNRDVVLWNSMISGIEPGVEHYACMVSVLSRAGKLSDAMEYISKMPVEPNAKVWGALLNGASVLGDVEIARFACDRLFEMEPGNTGNYTIMANMYSQAGRYEEAEIVRDKMRRIGLKKIPGTSWIESGKGLRSFIAKDSSCERSKEMYDVI